MRITIVRTTVGTALLAACCGLGGLGQQDAATVEPENLAARAAVIALTDPTGSTEPLTAIPADFEEVMGYLPGTLVDASGRIRVVNPTGSCSNPLPAPDLSMFDADCKAHDLGYDLLRYAGRVGGELGPWARRAIDARFAADIHDRAEQAGSGGVKAWLAQHVVELNTWRQHGGVPVTENLAPQIVTSVTFAGAALGWVLRHRRPVATPALPRSGPARGR